MDIITKEQFPKLNLGKKSRLSDMPHFPEFQDHTQVGYGQFNHHVQLKDTLERRNNVIHKSKSELNLSNIFEQANIQDFVRCKATTGLFPSKILDTGSDSVIEFSIASGKSLKNNSDIVTKCHPSKHCPYSIDELNNAIQATIKTFEDTKPQKNYLLTLAVDYLPSLIYLVQTTNLFNESNGQNNTEFELSIQHLFNVILLPQMAKMLECVKDTSLTLTANETKQVSTTWTSLKYFSLMLLDSVLYNSKSSSKIICITFALETSKLFINLSNILSTIAHDISIISDDTIQEITEQLLVCTAELRSADIMIGIPKVLETWITNRQALDSKSKFIKWVETKQRDWHLNTEYININDENDEEDLLDEECDENLMFNKFEIVELFLRDIALFCGNQNQAYDDDQIGWLTVFDNDGNDTGLNRNMDQFSEIQSIQTPKVQNKHSFSEWLASQQGKLIKHYNEWKDMLIDKFVYYSAEQTIITSVRHYNAILHQQTNYNPPPERTTLPEDWSLPGDVSEFPSEAGGYLKDKVRRLYKKERRGGRKRDALKVLFS